MNKLTIIIPAYNAELYIEKCLDSICTQEGDFECIIVDDGSTDSTLNICKEYSKKHAFIKVIRQENQGVSKARNKGILNADAEWIMFLDADDWLTPNAILTVLNGLKKEEADFYIWNFFNIYSDGNRNERKYYLSNIGEADEFIKSIFSADKTHADSANIVHPFAKCFKKAIIQRNNLYFQEMNLGEDTLFNYEYLKKCHKCIYYDAAIYNRQIHENSLTTKKGIKEAKKVLFFCTRLIEEVIEQDRKQKIEKLVYLFCFDILNIGINKLITDKKMQTIYSIGEFLRSDVVKKIIRNISIRDFKRNINKQILFCCYKYNLKLITFIIYMVYY